MRSRHNTSTRPTTCSIVCFVVSSKTASTAGLSGAEALEILQQEPLPATTYDAILCDLMMPGMTGMELFEVLRREHPTLAARVVFMTGGVSMLRVSEFLESVPNAKFEKPFDIAELRRTLHGLVASSREQRPSAPPQASI